MGLSSLSGRVLTYNSSFIPITARETTGTDGKLVLNVNFFLEIFARTFEFNAIEGCKEKQINKLNKIDILYPFAKILITQV